MLKNCLYYYTAINILQSGCSEPVENVTINRNHFGVCFADCPLYGTGFAKNSTILKQIRLSRFCVPESQSGVGFFFLRIHLFKWDHCKGRNSWAEVHKPRKPPGSQADGEEWSCPWLILDLTAGGGRSMSWGSGVWQMRLQILSLPIWATGGSHSLKSGISKL